VVQGAAACHHEIADTLLPQAEPVLGDAAVLATTVDMLDPQPMRVLRKALRMDAAALGGAQHEAQAAGLDEQDILDGRVLLLAAITRRLLRRVWGAAEASFRPVMGTRGASSVARGVDSSSRGVTPVAATAAAPLGQGRQGAGRSIAEGAQRHQQRGQEDVHPLMRWALAHAQQAPLSHLERLGLKGDQHAEPSSVLRGHGTVLGDCEPAGDARLPIEAPHDEMCLARRLEGRDELLTRIERQAGQSQAC
jgi:hypothetical protein